MNRTPEQPKQKVIIPKGTVRENETAVIEIPIEYQNEPVVIVKPKKLTSTKSCPGSKSQDGVNLGLMHTSNLNDTTDGSLGIMNESQMNSGFGNVKHSPSCGNNVCVNQANPATKSFKKITKTVIKTSPADDSSCSLNCPSNVSNTAPSRVYKKVITTTITEGLDGQITTTTTTTSNKALKNIPHSKKVCDKSSEKTDGDTINTPKPEQKNDVKPENEKEASVIENQEKVVDDNSGYHIDSSLGILRPDEINVTQSITGDSKKDNDENSVAGTQTSIDINTSKENNKGSSKPDEMNVSNAGNNPELSHPPQPLAASTPRSSKDKCNIKSKKICSNRNCAANSSKGEVRSYKKVVKKTTITKPATDDTLGLLNASQMKSACSGATNTSLGVMKSGQTNATFLFSSNTKCNQSPYENSGQDSLGIIHSGQIVNGFGPCGTDQNKQQIGQTFVQRNDNNQTNSGFMPCHESPNVSCCNANQTSLGIMQPGQMNSGFGQYSNANQSSLGIMQSGQMNSNFIPCNNSRQATNQSNLGQTTYTPATSRPRINLNATQVQQTGSSMRSYGNANEYNVPYSNLATFGSNVAQMHSQQANSTFNQNSLGQMSGGNATYGVRQSTTSCCPYTEINGMMQSGQMGSRFITRNIDQISSSYGSDRINDQSSLGMMKPTNPAFVPCAESTRIYLNSPCNDSNQSSLGIIRYDPMCNEPSCESTLSNLSAMQPGLNIATNRNNPAIMQPNQMSNNATYALNTNRATNNATYALSTNQMCNNGTYTLSTNQSYLTDDSSLGMMKPMNPAFVPCAESTRIYLNNPCNDSNQSSLGMIQSDQICTGPCSVSMISNLSTIQYENQNNPVIMQPNRMNNNTTFVLNPNQTNVTNESSLKPEHENAESGQPNQMSNTGSEISGATADQKQTFQYAPTTNTEGSLGSKQSISSTTERVQPNQTGSNLEAINVTNQTSASFETSSATTENLKQQAPATSADENLSLIQSGQANATFNISGTTEQSNVTQDSVGLSQSEQMKGTFNKDINQISQQASATGTSDNLGQSDNACTRETCPGISQPCMRAGFESISQQASATSTSGLMQSRQNVNPTSSKDFKMQQATQNGCFHEACLGITQSGPSVVISTANSQQYTPPNCKTTILPNQSSQTSQNLIPTMTRSRPSYKKITKTTTITRKSDEDSRMGLMPSTEMHTTSYISSSLKQPSYRKVIKTTTITKTPVNESALDQMNNYYLSPKATSTPNVSVLSSGQIDNICRSEYPSSICNRNTTVSSSQGLLQSNQINSAPNSHFTPHASSKAPRSECPSRYSRNPMDTYGSSYSQNNTSLGLVPGTYIVGNISNHSGFNKCSVCQKGCPSLRNVATQQSFSENTLGLLPSSYLNTTDYFNNSRWNNQMRTTLSSRQAVDRSGILPSNCLSRSTPTTNRTFGLQRTLYSPVRQFKYFNSRGNNNPLCQTPISNSSRYTDNSLGLLSSSFLNNYNSDTKDVHDQISRILSSTPVLKRSEERDAQQLNQTIELQLKTTEAAEQIELHNDLKNYQQTRRQLVANASRMANLRENDIPTERN